MKTDVIIIGAGILGIAHAYECLIRGLSVAVFEKNSHPQESTVRNFGQVVPSGFGVKWQNYGRQSLKSYARIQSEVDISVKAGGSIYIASNEEEMTLLEELKVINHNQDYESKMLSKLECLYRYPGLNPDYVLGGLFFPQEITVDPTVAIHRIIKFLQDKYNLQYYPNHQVKDVVKRITDVQITTASNKQYKANKVFICNGSDYHTLFPDHFKDSGIQRVKIQMMSTTPQENYKLVGSILTGWTIRRYESFQECPSYNEIKSKEDKEAYHNRLGVHILFKQSPDGSIIIGDSHEYTDVFAANPKGYLNSTEINQFMKDEAKKIFSLPSYEIAQTWIGYYSQCKSKEIFEKTIDSDIHIVTAIGGKGMTASLGYAKQNINSLL